MVESKEVVRELQGMRDDGHLSDALLRRAVRRIASSDKRISWVGVYLLNAEGNELWLHNYVGSPTEHAKIAVGKGVCGTAAARRETVVVEDVHAFPGHIACDSASNSEIVVPLVRGGELLGVLDLDSPKHARFGAADQQGLEALARIFIDSLGSS